MSAWPRPALLTAALLLFCLATATSDFLAGYGSSELGPVASEGLLSWHQELLELVEERCRKCAVSASDRLPCRLQLSLSLTSPDEEPMTKVFDQLCRSSGASNGSDRADGQISSVAALMSKALLVWLAVAVLLYFLIPLGSLARLVLWPFKRLLCEEDKLSRRERPPGPPKAGTMASELALILAVLNSMAASYFAGSLASSIPCTPVSSTFSPSTSSSPPAYTPSPWSSLEFGIALSAAHSCLQASTWFRGHGHKPAGHRFVAAADRVIVALMYCGCLLRGATKGANQSLLGCLVLNDVAQLGLAMLDSLQARHHDLHVDALTWAHLWDFNFALLLLARLLPLLVGLGPVSFGNLREFWGDEPWEALPVLFVPLSCCYSRFLLSDRSRGLIWALRGGGGRPEEPGDLDDFGSCLPEGEGSESSDFIGTAFLPPSSSIASLECRADQQEWHSQQHQQQRQNNHLRDGRHQAREGQTHQSLAEGNVLRRDFAQKDVEGGLGTSKESVRVAVGGQVYEVHDFLKNHPGGESVLRDYHDKDATEAFERSHHAGGRARSLLQQLPVIGKLRSEPQVVPASPQDPDLSQQPSAGTFGPYNVLKMPPSSGDVLSIATQIVFASILLVLAASLPHQDIVTSHQEGKGQDQDKDQQHQQHQQRQQDATLPPNLASTALGQQDASLLISIASIALGFLLAKWVLGETSFFWRGALPTTRRSSVALSIFALTLAALPLRGVAAATALVLVLAEARCRKRAPPFFKQLPEVTTCTALEWASMACHLVLPIGNQDLGANAWPTYCAKAFTCAISWHFLLLSEAKTGPAELANGGSSATVRGPSGRQGPTAMLLLFPLLLVAAAIVVRSQVLPLLLPSASSRSLELPPLWILLCIRTCAISAAALVAQHCCLHFAAAGAERGSTSSFARQALATSSPTSSPSSSPERDRAHSLAGDQDDGRALLSLPFALGTAASLGELWFAGPSMSGFLALLGWFLCGLRLAGVLGGRVRCASAAYEKMPLSFGLVFCVDAARSVVAMAIWSTGGKALEAFVTSVLPRGLRVVAFDAPIDDLNGRLVVGLCMMLEGQTGAAGPPVGATDGDEPKHVVLNIGHLPTADLDDLRATVRTSLDIMKELDGGKEEGFVANVLCVLPTKSSSAWPSLGVAWRSVREINLSVWSDPAHAGRWYRRSKGHREIVSQHRSGTLKTFGNLLLSLDASSTRWQRRCRACRLTEDGLDADTCTKCGAETWKLPLF